MDAFGVVRGATKLVRVMRLEERLTPAVPFPHKHGFHHIVVVTGGGGWHEIDFTRHAVKRGRVFAMKPPQVHAWAMTSRTTGFVIELVDEALTGKDDATRTARRLLSGAPDVLDVEADAWPRVAALCELLHAEYEGRARHFELTVSAALVALLIVLLRTREEPTAPGHDLVDRYKALIDEHYKTRHDLGFYARRLGLGSKALTMRVTRATGTSALRLIQDRCLLEAKRLLAYSDLSVAAIAETLGFDDPAYFGRLFRKKEGTSPGRFRAHARHSS